MLWTAPQAAAEVNWQHPGSVVLVAEISMVAEDSCAAMELAQAALP